MVNGIKSVTNLLIYLLIRKINIKKEKRKYLIASLFFILFLLLKTSENYNKKRKKLDVCVAFRFN